MLQEMVHFILDHPLFYGNQVSDNVKEKDAKIAFLNKLIDATKTLSQTNLSVKATKVVAGLEPTNTNLLLQAIAKSLDAKVDSSQYIKQLKLDNKNEKVKKSSIPKPQKAKSVNRSSVKDEKDSKSSKNSKKSVDTKPKIDTPKLKLDTPIGSKEKISARKDDTKHKTGRRGREEKKETKDTKKISKAKESPKTEESPKTDDTPNTNSSKKEENIKESLIQQSESIDEYAGKKDSTKTDAIRRNSYTIEKNKEMVPNDVNTEHHSLQNKGELEVQSNAIKTIKDKDNKSLFSGQNDKKYEEQEESTKNLVRPKSARPKSGEIKIMSTSKEEKSNIQQGSKRLEMDHPHSKPLVPPSRPKSSLRPPSVRPSSARPGAPRLRPDSALPLQEPIAMGNINVIVERVDTTAADEEETVVIETAPSEPEVVSEVNVDLDNKGHLVEQILEQLEESGGKKRTEIDWEPDVAARSKEGIAKDVSQLAGIVQNLTKTAIPLGKLINYVHEDIEAMQSELQMWINTKKQLYAEIRKQKSLNVESSKPLLSNLEALNQDIKKLKLEITQINSKMLKNDTRIKELLCK